MSQKLQRASVPPVEWDEDTLPSGPRLLLWILMCLLGLTGLVLSFISQPLFYPEL
jgi:hypothetical protein